MERTQEVNHEALEMDLLAIVTCAAFEIVLVSLSRGSYCQHPTLHKLDQRRAVALHSSRTRSSANRPGIECKTTEDEVRSSLLASGMMGAPAEKKLTGMPIKDLSCTSPFDIAAAR
jgi:hypothetical protein